MKRQRLWLMTVLLLFATGTITRGDDTMTDNTIQKLVAAIKASDVDIFRGSLTPDFATDMTPKAVAALIEQLSPAMAAGYSVQGLGSLQQDGMNVQIYKISMKYGGNDLLLRAVMDGDKIAGLLITNPFE
jgi:hypothetical protein